MTMTETGAPSCPKCGGNMWDNRLTKKNPKQPDFKCKNQPCEGVIWPPRNGAAPARVAAPAPAPASYGGPLPWEQQETGAPPQPYAPVVAASPNGDRLANQFATYTRCLDQARTEILRAGIDKLGGDVAGAVVAMAATLYIQASK